MRNNPAGLNSMFPCEEVLEEVLDNQVEVVVEVVVDHSLVVESMETLVVHMDLEVEAE